MTVTVKGGIPKNTVTIDMTVTHGAEPPRFHIVLGVGDSGRGYPRNTVTTDMTVTVCFLQPCKGNHPPVVPAAEIITDMILLEKVKTVFIHPLR